MPGVEIEELTSSQCRDIFAAATQRIGITPDEFMRRWRSGEFADNPDPEVTRIAMLMPEAWYPFER